MGFSFTQAIEAIGKGCNTAINTVRERVLPTPGKRKRSDEEEVGPKPFQEKEDRERPFYIKVDKVQRAASVNPPSQFAVAAEPPGSTAGDLQGMELEEAGQDTGDVSTPPAAKRHNASPGKSAYPSAGASGRPGPVPAPRYSSRDATPMYPGGARMKPALGSTSHTPSLPQYASPVPWQRRYPGYEPPLPSYVSTLGMGPNVHFGPFARQAQMEHFSMRPGSALWTQFQGRGFGGRQAAWPRRQTAQQDREDRELLRKLTKEAMRNRPAFLGGKAKPAEVIDLERPASNIMRQADKPNIGKAGASQRHAGVPPPSSSALFPSQLAPAGVHHAAVPLRQAMGQSTGLSIALFELEQRRGERHSEQLKKDSEALKARCEELMGEEQARLMARASAALGEKETAHNAAAEISRASMQVAKQEAEALFGRQAEVGFLEQQQKRMAQLRQAQQAQQEALSSIKPLRQQTLQHARHQQAPAAPSSAASSRRQGLAAAKTKQQPPAKEEPAEEVVDLLSSDGEQDEAETRHDDTGSQGQDAGSEGEGSQQEVSYPDDDDQEEVEEVGSEADQEVDEGDEEEGVRAKLLDISVHGRKRTPQFPPLTRHQRLKHRDALDIEADQKTELSLHKGTNIGVTRGLMACLKPRTWLNDEVMNLFMGLLQDRDKEWRSLKKYPTCHFCNTFFFNKLYLDKGRYDYSEVARWTLPKKLQKCNQASTSVLDCNRIIAPVHLGVHWTCAMADLKHKEFVYYDSMGGKNRAIMESFRKYVAAEYLDKKKQTVNTSEWPIKYPMHIPQQQNGCDCGVFALIFAEHLSRDAPFDFDQSDMEYFRIMITAAIMDLKMPADFK